jgi:hypothetical protein
MEPHNLDEIASAAAPVAVRQLQRPQREAKIVIRAGECSKFHDTCVGQTRSRTNLVR